MITAVTITPAGLLDQPDVLGDGTGHIDLDFTNANQFVNETTNLIALNRDGNAPGHLGGLSVGMDGKITGRYSNGETRLLAQIPLAKFQNPAGLIKMGGNLFSLTPNSGDFDGIGLEGEIMGGVLEMSNVDLSQEFTEMITTQRGFQANSRVISTSDEMLQELVNLKR
jgi:flagellar hook protein FlgE